MFRNSFQKPFASATNISLFARPRNNVSATMSHRKQGGPLGSNKFTPAFFQNGNNSYCQERFILFV